MARASLIGMAGQARHDVDRMRHDQLITEEMTVPSEPGIDIYVRNKRPADLTAFTPERTLLFVHGSTYPAHTGFDLPLGGQSWMESIAVARLRRLLPRRARLRPLDAARGDGRAAAEQSAGRAHAGRGEGHHGGAQLHPQAPQHPAAQPARLVVGLHPDGDHRDPEPGQGRAADALRAGVAAHHAVAAQRRAGPARRLPHRDARAGQGALAQRRAGGQAGGADPGRLVRAMGRRHLGDRSGRRAAESAGDPRAERHRAGHPGVLDRPARRCTIRPRSPCRR